MPGPLPAIGVVLSFIAKQGAKEAVKKYGKQAVDNATKNKKTQSLKKDVEGLTKSLKEASKSPRGKESKLEKSAKKIEDMKKDPKFIRLRKRANEIRKKKGLPLKPEFSKGGMVTKWENKWG